MNVFTGWTGWAIFAVLLLCGWLLLGAALAAAWHLAKRAYMRHQIRAAAGRRQVEQRLRGHLHAEAERIGDGWPDDLCACPPCSLEDRWVCDQHQHQPEPGKHRLGSSQSRGHDVIQAVVTDLPDPWDSRWTR